MGKTKCEHTQYKNKLLNTMISFFEERKETGKTSLVRTHTLKKYLEENGLDESTTFYINLFAKDGILEKHGTKLKLSDSIVNEVKRNSGYISYNVAKKHASTTYISCE